MNEVDRRRLLSGAAALTAGALAAGTSRPAAAVRVPAGAPGPTVLRTPDHRFAGLPDYSFEPHYLRVPLGDGSRTTVRMHYIDERPARASGETILLLHGNPSWSYLYRHVIPALVAAGHRCVALDLVGMGRSDKPTDRFLYTYQQHMDWLTEAVFERLGLRDVTMVCHDWGGTLGLRLLAEHPDRFRRVVAMNTGLKTGREDIDGDGWMHLATWLQFTQRANPLTVSDVVAGFTTSTLDPDVLAAYDAPFPDDRYQHGVRRFAVLIPLSEHDEATPAFEAAWEVLETLDLPFLCVFGADDHVTGGRHEALSGRIPGAAGQPHTVLDGAHHFLQEDKAHEVAAAIDDFIRRTRS
ncbi:haloalkane dehalogenase [Jiangella anatolica]|uniref:Haloalkane dehalogenase n=1 Tax=Jiangella anatolica TaxID=2670374 RepID=A0A2W2BAR7_9ACTN|nr:haloalkane dehalogenase [Jiangella anatolica]PZF82330.1 haloalkane dehalogenase [Jiangella anatolica]